MPTRLILIRHGQTPWNIEKRYIGFADIDLNNKGIKQATKLRARLKNKKIYRVYSSDSKRALNFAKIIFRNFQIKKASQLREMNFGIFEGLTYKEIMKKYPEIYRRWLSDPFNTIVPGAESLKYFKKRVLRIVARIVSLNKNKTVAIVTHAGPIKIIINEVLKSKNIWNVMPDLASMSIIVFRKNQFHLVGGNS